MDEVRELETKLAASITKRNDYVKQVEIDEAKRDDASLSDGARDEARDRLIGIYAQRDAAQAEINDLISRRANAKGMAPPATKETEMPQRKPRAPRKTSSTQKPKEQATPGRDVAPAALILSIFAIGLVIIALLTLSILQDQVDSIDTDLGALEQQLVTTPENESPEWPHCPDGWYDNPPPPDMPEICTPEELS